jgi:prolyl-tRNA editing enzyme YbaK/EbsC (Cys-tRNA(Pro) deacylase)
VRVAKPDEVMHATGFEPGAVAPFPLRAVTQILMDRSFFVHDVVWIGAGSESHMASIAPPELLRLSGARPVDLVSHG